MRNSFCIRTHPLWVFSRLVMDFVYSTYYQGMKQCIQIQRRASVWTCTKCGCMMRLSAVVISPPATTKILRGLGVNLYRLDFTGPP